MTGLGCSGKAVPALWHIKAVLPSLLPPAQLVIPLTPAEIHFNTPVIPVRCRDQVQGRC
jgi:hypothetical protein